MFDLSFFERGPSPFFVAGCDEVGRGPLAGPVVAACVSLEINEYEPKELRLLFRKWKKLGVMDSKKLNSQKRLEILRFFSEGELVADQVYTLNCSKNVLLKILIKEIPAQTIDEVNILNASLQAMRTAMFESCNLDISGTVLIDGNKKFKCENPNIKLEAIVKGDSKSLIIGLASIAAKEYRDQLMRVLGEKYPGYGWEQNAGYPTKKHLEAIDQLGVTKLHRITFKRVKEIYAERGYNGVSFH